MNNRHAPMFRNNPASDCIVIFIHGFMGSPRQFDRLADVAYSHGASVAALLLPGHGGSPKDFAAGSFLRWQEHVDHEIVSLSRDYMKVLLVGHSMGGLLAINSSARFADRVCGLFLIACPFKLKPLSPYTIKIRLSQIFKRSSDPIKAAYLDGSSVTISPGILWSTFAPSYELKKLVFAALSEVSKIELPITAIYSLADEVTSEKSLEILCKAALETQVKSQLLTDSLHAYFPEHERSIIEKCLVDAITAMQPEKAICNAVSGKKDSPE